MPQARTQLGQTSGRLVVHPDGHEIAYWSFGGGEHTLLGIHGGIGVADHRYLLFLRALATDDLRVVLYDQLGSGEADNPDDLSLWTMPRFVKELESVRSQLDLGRVHLVGHSWGGQLALQYTLDHPAAVASLVVTGAGASGPEMVRGILEARLQLSSRQLLAMWRSEVSGSFHDPGYLEGILELTRRHVQRTVSAEDEAAIAKRLQERPTSTYLANWGPNDFCPISDLVDWDVTDRLSEVTTPTLVLSGLYDQVSLDCHRALSDGITGSEFVIFGNSSHSPFVEREAACYIAVLRDFIVRAIAGL